MKTTRLLCPWDSLGKDTGVGSHSLLQGISRPRDWTWISCIAGREARKPFKTATSTVNKWKRVIWGITTNKASGGDGIPVQLFQILKDDTVKMLHSICQQIWKTQQWPQDWKGSVFIPIPKKGNAKECSNYRTVALISHASKVMLKILQTRLQQYVNRELPDVQAGFRKGRGTRNQIANIHWVIKKAREFQENIYFCFIDYCKAFDFASQWTV